MAAARHSSNTTAEGMSYLPIDLGPQYSMEALVGQLAGKVKHTFSQSKLTGGGWVTWVLFLLCRTVSRIKPCCELGQGD